MRHITGTSLWIGTARDARDIRSVMAARIEAIVDLAKMCAPVEPTRELVYLRFPLEDGGDNPPWLIRAALYAVEGLAKLAVPALIACDGGMSRSLVITAAALRFQTPVASLDELLRRIATGGPADVQPALWADVKRYIVAEEDVRYKPNQ
jgi:protein-tyrosine phosphatase